MFLGLNEKAWAGINILVFGKTPMLPMQLEQALAQASPANEIRIDSFEDYDQAYDFCKAQKSIGLIFISENSGEALAADIFKQLGCHYESKGWPCFGILLHEGEKSIAGYESLHKNKNLIGYYSINDILRQERTFNTLGEVWKTFVTAFENSIMPEKLQETLLNLAEPILSHESYNFKSRASILLSQNLNISWLDAIALRWQPVVSALKIASPAALTSNAALVQIADMAAPHEKIKDIFIVSQMRTNLGSRLASVVNLLDQARIQNNLSAVFNKLEGQLRPGGPALLKQVISCKEKIFSVAADYGEESEGVVG